MPLRFLLFPAYYGLMSIVTIVKERSYKSVSHEIGEYFLLESLRLLLENVCAVRLNRIQLSLDAFEVYLNKNK
jgi:hypothetical protein